jgi:polyisoprenoid-binding protein YceI
MGAFMSLRGHRRWMGGGPVALAAAVLAMSMSPPLAAEQRLLTAQSEIGFTSRQMGVPVQGRFRNFDAQLEFDPRQPDAARFALHIDLASVSLGTAETEAELAKPGWFDTRRFPRASFTSTRVKSAGPGRYEVTGTLTLKGTSRELTVPVTLLQAGPATTASGAFAIRRLDFRIGDGDWSDPSLVADEVQVTFRLALAGVAAP